MAPHFVQPDSTAAGSPTFVLIHGAGNTSAVWRSVQEQLLYPSLAVDLPGRRDRVAPIAEVRLEDAIASISSDIAALRPGPLILVGHSAGGIVVPGLAARWADVAAELVFVAGLCAPDGERVVSTVRPDAQADFAARLGELRRRCGRCMLEPDSGLHGWDGIDEATAMAIDSLNYMDQIVSWAGVPDVPRTFVRCLRDRIQSPPLQDKLINNCRATAVLELACGHNPALAAPAELARLLNGVASRR